HNSTALPNSRIVRRAAGCAEGSGQAASGITRGDCSARAGADKRTTRTRRARPRAFAGPPAVRYRLSPESCLAGGLPVLPAVPERTPLKIVFFGSSDFALPTLRALKEHGFAPTLVVTKPEDRKSTRLNSSHVKISYAVF